MNSIRNSALKAGLVACITIAAVPITATMAAAQMCTDREVFVEQLDANYSEQSERIGLMPNGNILEVFSSPSGSFTIIVSDPQGRSCMIASGEGCNRIVNGPSNIFHRRPPKFTMIEWPTMKII